MIFRIAALVGVGIGLSAAPTIGTSTAFASADEPTARQILEATGVRGGLVVHVGCGDGRLTAGLHAGDGFLVHGLDTNAAGVAEARAYLRSQKLYGPVTVDTFDGVHLPHIDGVAKLLVAESPGDVTTAEIMRVLAPLGVAYVKQGGRWRKTVKPWPAEIDEWTHYMHDASNNAVAHDRRIGPPRHLQWQAGPRWSRHHDHMASVSALVSAGGRMFSIVDEGSRVSPQLPPDWKLVARDAFSGVLLWKRPISKWFDHLWPLKSGPANLPRRLVAVGETVYVTLGIDAPVSALNAATGETIRTYENTAHAEEIVLKDGVLLVVINRTPVDPAVDLPADVEQGRSRDRRTTYSPKMAEIWAGVRSRRWTAADRSIRAFDAESGRRLWQKDSRVIPLTLAADPQNVYYHDGDKIVALELKSGEPRWTTEPVPVWEGLEGRGLQSWFAPTLVVADGRVFFAGGEKTHMSYMGWGSKDIGQDTMTAFSAAMGEKLWTADHPYAGYNSPEDLFVTGGRVWIGKTAKGGDGRYLGRNLETGELADDFPPTVDTYWFHHRCHRAKATDRYILCSRTGIEFVDLKTGEWTINHWVRGGCLYGIMPCNGLVYSPPHPCACYPEAKLFGFTALAATREEGETGRGGEGETKRRLVHGPAFESLLSPSGRGVGGEGSLFGATSPHPAAPPSPANGRGLGWPTYRGDAARSGAVASSVAPKLRAQWEVELGRRLTQPVAAGGRVFVAEVDAHTVHALDAASGEKLWSYTAGGRIDSPPTIVVRSARIRPGRGASSTGHSENADRMNAATTNGDGLKIRPSGLCLFGSADGYVYCLRADDGELVWRFRAAPADRRLVAFGRLESAWPVHGSVLVQDGVATVVAGRSMYLDGGLRLCRLDAATGRLLGEKILDDRDPETGENMQRRVKGLDMPVALPDILSSDGEHLFMRSQAMDLEGNRLSLGGKAPEHLFAAYGFTDDTWFHRIYWLYGNSFRGGVGGFGNAKNRPAGRIMVNNDSTVFAYGRKPQHYRWSSVADYHLYAAAKPGSDAGTARAIYFQNSPSLNPEGKPLSIAAWVKTDAADGTVLVRGAQAIGFALILTDRRPRMLLRVKNTTHEAVAREPIGSEWTHVAGVLNDDGRMAVYVDGKPAGSAENVPRLTGDPIIPMKVGYDDTNQLLPEPLTPLDGSLDEVMLFYRALSPEEIARLAEGPAKLSDEDRREQVLHLAFSGGKVRDRSPAGNHGKLDAEPKTTDGPVGEALVLRQPKKVIIPKAGSGSRVAYQWTREVPMMVRAMALAGDTLLIAGPPDVLDEEAAFQSYSEKTTQKQIAEQDAALRGRRGALFHLVDATTGETLAEYALDAPPVFDGLSTAAGRVYLATVDGRVVAYAEDLRPVDANVPPK